jgi:hypothetical protein
MKRFVFYCPVLILLSFFTSCDDRLDDFTNEESVWQVYEEWGEKMYVDSDTVLGNPHIPTLVYDGTPLPGATLTPDELPCTVQGFIKSGILSIDFPKTLNLSDEYSSEHSDGIKIALVHIQKNIWQHIALHKLDEQHSGVKIYYTDKDMNCETRNGSEIQLKAGWNFWDGTNNIISQDINDFFSKGYRWRWESWQ